VGYIVLSALLLCYLANGYVLLAWALLTRGREARRRDEMHRMGEQWLRGGEWPAVLTQIPLYNESTVAARVIDAVAGIDYPHGLHHIQILDDSTDETREIVDACVKYWRTRGVGISVVRRADRRGFKAGALQHGLALHPAEFVAIFDADFVPPPDFLRRTIPTLAAGPKLGWVQARWEHLNAELNVLTRAQATGIDAHFAIEQSARSAGFFMAFNGSAGVWRRKAIEDAGGWSDATLTEDLDLSCRAALHGWRGLLLPEVTVPAELPQTFTAFQAQQYRWAKGSLQTARRLVPKVWRSDWPRWAKIQTTLHLTQYLLQPLLVMLTLLTPWMALTTNVSFTGGGGTGGQLLIALALVSTTYFSGQRLLSRPWGTAGAGVGALLLAGTSSALGSTRAAVGALLGFRSDFVRTPKDGDGIGRRYGLRRVVPLFFQGLFAAYCMGGIGVCLFRGWFAAVPMLFFCASGSALGIFLDGADGSVDPDDESETASRTDHGHVSV
jgi:cellulose synthase/poly-beta-1,6-N-acetylglucosamine synthase-like glycosyltransferase